MPMKTLSGALAAVLIAGTATAALADDVKIGNLVDFTGATSTVSKPFSEGKAAAFDWINAHGGVNGKKIVYDTVDYSYQAPRAIAAYKRWVSEFGAVAIAGWGTADTEALVGFLVKDEMPYISGSYSAHLTDPTGKTSKAATPYNFFYNVSYSDGLRGMLQWALEDWKKKGGQGTPKYVHMGDNHPYPNAARKAGEEYAKELGFEVLPAIQYSLAPADFKAQCLTLKQSGANYAYLGNTAGSNISLLKSCETVGVEAQFMANIWGFDESAAEAAGTASNGVVWVVGAATWNDDEPGMKLVREIAGGDDYKPVHYTRGICTAFYLKEALEWADKNGGLTGPNIRQGFYQKADWVPAGLDGVCFPSTWTPEDHRGTVDMYVYQAAYNDGKFSMKRLAETKIERRPEWLGW
ncbi:MAG: branched-chain amino acid ABC transporter substrate-binding protein [Tistrella sp.]|uniref:Branched-chain amino acid ABC transporter substrate-binding protein n=1 Tax=Tistrella mobilis TaxID=171437 RepID=A0A162LCP2_9PROT|nr:MULTISPECIES: ABC transporter substrate-binding protein [Tistrella]KYO54365.1 branched-chain amino acid ABC transporter substrate-binding protein [Tistrella mobilis]MAD38126.1 branched-chain amino acid ABC transporter substrate-binding protein [Tistrella sp.]MBA75456.1 branched-chain amino acid ABC transporter substrate-binding protein [Tistrella sp.]HAE50650.1 branched-chain amino acid ABC transporter substrate-binding protein [Tistrella mobilis]